MILIALGWIAAIALLALAASCAWHGWHEKVRGQRPAAGLYACIALVLMAIDGILAPLIGAVLAFLALALAALAAMAEGRKALPGSRWKGAVWCTRFAVTSGPRYLGTDTRGLAGRLRRWWAERDMDEIPDPEPAPPAAPIQFSPNGADSMPTRTTRGNGTRPPANGTVQQPAIRARRIATQAGAVPVPAGWAAVVVGTTDFEAESNVDLVQWMTSQVLGLAAWSEAIVEQHEANRALGVDAAAISMLHDVADAGVTAAQTMAAAVSQLCNYFELPDAFVDAGGNLAHSGDWHQGSPG